MSDVAVSEHPIRCCSRCHAIYRKEADFCPSDGGEIVDADVDPLLGMELEHFVIDALIGEGAMGRVYRAHHRTLVGKQYAVKVLIGDLASAQSMRMRFVNEAKSAGRLSHPNVVSVVDFGRSEGGLIYLVMELVDGSSLANLIDEGPLDPERVAKLARGVAEGLRHAHELGLVHRDLKPENVIVVQTPEGELPRVVDFGIAVSIDRGDLRLTSTGMAMGTPAYVAPEQVSTNELDARADQYSLGVTIFEALTGGILPFVGDPMDVVTAKVANEAPRLAERMPEGVALPPGLARIVEKMIARSPKQRYRDLGEVVAALDQWLQHRGFDTDVVPIRRRRRRLGAIAAVVAVGAVGTLLALTLTHTSSASETQVAHAAPPIEPVKAARPAPAAAPLATPAPSAPTSTPPDPAPEAVDPPPSEPSVATRPTKSKRPSGRRPPRGKTVAAAPPVEPTPAPAPAPTPAPPIAVAAPRPAEVPLQARVVGVDVQGSLSQAVIQRAVDRVRPALERCTSSGTPHTVRVQFTIDESKRAHGVRGSGAPQASVDCVVTALGGVRTESAPDVGDTEVVVRIGFGTRS